METSHPQVMDMAVFVGLSTIDIIIPDSHSLKDKRRVVRSLLDRIRSRFNVSACEADNLDNWQRATLAFTCVANEENFVHECLMHIANLVEGDGRVTVEDVCVEFFPAVPSSRRPLIAVPSKRVRLARPNEEV